MSVVTLVHAQPHRVPAPRCEPPFDPEGPRAPRPGGGALLPLWRDGDRGGAAPAVSLTAAAPPAGDPAAEACLDRAARGGGSVRPAPRGVHPAPPEGRRAVAWEDAQPTPRCELPDPRGWGARLAVAALEVLAGDRPVAQLLKWTSEEAYAAVCRQLAALDRPPLAGRCATRHPLPVVGSVHVGEPADGVAEVCAVARVGPRARAVALRLEGLDGRWTCTALQVG